MQGLQTFLDQLKIADERPIEPDLKPDKKEKDRAIKEEQDLQAGAVLEAVIAEGQGNDTPQEGDLVYVHYSIADTEGDVLWTTWAEDGGSGQPFAFVLGKGWRAPRAWELSIQGMTRNMRKRLKVQPRYGYQHPDCRMTPPAGVDPGQVLHFELQLVHWYPTDQVRALGEHSNMFKRVLQESDKWEVARAPNEVTFTCQAYTPAYDGHQLTGFCYFNTPDGQPTSLQLGNNQLPAGLEDALSNMTKGEKTVFVLPATEMRNPGAAATRGCSSRSKQQLMPDPPVKAQQVELCIHLQDLVQVRDMTGDGAVTKKRLQEGSGEFPIDCPLHDTTVRLHFRLRTLEGGRPGPWLYSSLKPDGSSSSTSRDWGDVALGAAGTAVEVDTGCGELPEGLEMVVKLMVPGELALAVCQPRYAYQGRSDGPPGLDCASAVVEFEVVLVSFDREGYWQNLSWEERWRLAARLKDKGNALFRDKKYGYAANKYQHLLRLLESTRDFEEQAQLETAEEYKSALISNMALALFHQGEFARSVDWCDKALQLDPVNAKVLFRKGKALSMKGDYEEAEEHLTAAGEIDTSMAADVEAAKAANAQRAKAAEAKQKQQFKNFFSKSS